MDRWLLWYLGFSVLTVLISAGLLFRRLPAASARAVGRRWITWVALAALVGALAWPLLGCVGFGLLEAASGGELGTIAGCLPLAAFFAVPVVLALVPGYAALVGLYLHARIGKPVPGRQQLCIATGLLALPAICLIVAGYAGVLETRPTWEWPEARRVLPLLIVTVWGALLLPRLLVPSLAPNRVEALTAGAHTARAAV